MMKDLDSTVRLNNGVAMPWLGLGVWQAERGEAYRAVLDAIAIGYRHVDTAKIYGNEDDVGRAVRESGVPRDQLFVTTKLWNADHGYDKALHACEQSLKRLGLDYVDLYLIHWPEPKRHDSWRALVKLQAEGKCRAIGVSNFTTRHLDELARASDVVPQVNQVEFHPFLHQTELLAHCRARGIQLEAYSPLARAKRISHPEIVRVAKKLGRTPAQVMIRWALQHEVIAIPKSTRRERIEENARVFDFTIAPDDVAALDALDESIRTCWDPTQVP
jgi:diketogulonate reductase-like aldo/keto reductase